MSEAHAEYRLFAGEVPYEVDADAGLLRSARSRRDQNPLGRHRLDLRDGHLVIALHHYLSPKFTQVLHQVVGEAVVVIEDKNHFFPPPPKIDEKKPPILPNTPFFFAGGASPCWVAGSAASRLGCSGAFGIGNSAAWFKFSGAIDCNESVIGGGGITDSPLNTNGTSS